MRPSAALLVLLLLLVSPSSAGAAVAPVQRAVQLSCGEGVFRIESAVFPGPKAPFAPARQTLTLQSESGTHKIALERQGLADIEGIEVQRAYVSSWACVRADTGKSYVELEYDCANDPGTKGACPQGKEWFHLIDARGRVLDQALSNDAAKTRLEARLGLSGAMAAGVAMQDVLSTDP